MRQDNDENFNGKAEVSSQPTIKLKIKSTRKRLYLLKIWKKGEN